MKERTLVLIKPDGMKAHLLTEVIRTFLFRGMVPVKYNQIHADRALAEKLYPDSKKQLAGMGKKTLSAMGQAQAKKLFRTTDPLKIGRQLREWSIEFITSRACNRHHNRR